MTQALEKTKWTKLWPCLPAGREEKPEEILVNWSQVTRNSPLKGSWLWRATHLDSQHELSPYAPGITQWRVGNPHKAWSIHNTLKILTLKGKNTIQGKRALKKYEKEDQHFSFASLRVACRADKDEKGPPAGNRQNKGFISTCMRLLDTSNGEGSGLFFRGRRWHRENVVLDWDGQIFKPRGRKKPKTWSLAPARGSLAMGVVAGDSAGWTLLFPVPS